MSSAWTPAAGMLYEDSTGRWGMAKLHYQSQPGFPLLNVLGCGPFTPEFLAEQRPDYKPLAPAVTHGGLFEALLQVPGAELVPAGYPMPSENQIRIPLEAGDLWMARNGLRYHLFGNMGAADNYEARGRDWQKEGAIRAYAAQPGWGGGE